MNNVTLGRTGIVTDKNGFGGLPIQRISQREAIYLLHKACDAGITYYDTARAYLDSEEKIGSAFVDRRDKVYLATKTTAKDGETLQKDLETSLHFLETDYIDVYQLHNIDFVPYPGGSDGLYDALLKAKAEGKILHIAITNHRLPLAIEAAESGLYELIQFPFSYISNQKELDLVDRCRELDVGFVAMKALAGGVLHNSAAAYAWMLQYHNVLPIWGIQREWELDEFLSYIIYPPVMSEALQTIITKDREELREDFCRGCGYCLPCPAGIVINTAARISQLIRRSPSEYYLTSEFAAEMARVDNCLHCGACLKRCPYNLDTPALLAKNYQDYKEILAGKPI